MPFPDSQRVLYKKNPLAEVVCQLRFPTILRISMSPADFQDRIRQDYPVYRKQEPQIGFPPDIPKELAALVEQINLPVPQPPPAHRFYTKEQGRFIALSQEFLALAETKYQQWEQFRTELMKAEEALREIYKPAFYSRIGLRYRNVISRGALGLGGVEWRDLLKSHTVAELGDKDISSAVERIQTQSVIKISDMPEARVTLVHGLATRLGSDEVCYVIDADFSMERKEGIDGPFDILDKFNRVAGRLFRWAITEKLHHAMDPRPI